MSKADVCLEFALSQRGQRWIELSQGTQEQPNAKIRSGVSDGVWGVGDRDASRGTSVDIDLVVPCAVVADELDGFG